MRRTWPVLLFAMTWPTVATLLYFVTLASPEAQAEGANPLLRAAYFGTKVIQFALPVVWLGWWCGEDVRPAWPSWKGLSLGVGFGLLVFTLMMVLYFGGLRDSSLMQRTVVPLRAKVADFGAAKPSDFILLGAFITLMHSLLEEYYWRWFVFGQLDRYVPTPGAIVLSGLAFAAHHVVVLAVYFPNRLWLAGLLGLGVGVGGMFWAWLYHRTGSIWAGWISHALIDAAIMVIGYEMLFAPNYNVFSRPLD